MNCEIFDMCALADCLNSIANSIMLLTISVVVHAAITRWNKP